jgi:hypothetical protein
MPIFKKKPEVVLISVVLVNDEATIKKIVFIEKLTDKDVEKGVLTIVVDKADLENGFLTLSEGDWLVKEGKEISVYDAHEFAKTRCLKKKQSLNYLIKDVPRSLMKILKF